MPFATPAEFLAYARDRGLLSAERIDELTADATMPANVDDFLAVLRERGLLAADVADEPAPVALMPTEEATDPPAILLSDEPYALPAVSSVASTRAPSQPMSRENMWLWFAVGGGLWLIGLAVLGAWLGGCLNDSPKPRTKTVNATK